MISVMALSASSGFILFFNNSAELLIMPSGFLIFMGNAGHHFSQRGEVLGFGQLLLEAQALDGPFFDDSFAPLDHINQGQQQNSHYNADGGDNQHLVFEYLAVIKGQILSDFYDAQYRSGDW